jgi:23S rRNA pseudouridine1911/1915/1917 synthase
VSREGHGERRPGADEEERGGQEGGGREPGEEEPGEDLITTEVPALLDGVRVDRGVAMMANVSRAVAAQLIDAGRVSLDGERVRAGRSVLRPGAVLRVLVPPDRDAGVAADPSVPFGVLYADDALAVVDKPAGIVVHPGAGHSGGTLVGGLLAQFPDLADLVSSGVCTPDRPGIVHRLDKGTSGLLAVARTADAYRALVQQLGDRTMERRYLALVCGHLPEDRGEVEAPIGRSARTPTKMAVAAAGKPAKTSYTVLERRDEEVSTTLIDVALRSGRTHQIRVHMAAIGHPVVGDSRYGTADRRLGSGRFFLHAFWLAFDHPVSGARLEFSSALPTDLEEFLRAS